MPRKLQKVNETHEDFDHPALKELAAEAAKRFDRPYRVLVVDDHPLVRRGIRTLLESQPDIEVAWEAAGGREAISMIKTGKPDLVVLDLTIPEVTGLEVLTTGKQDSPSTEFLILSMHFSDELAREALRCGALAYVLKSDADSELLVAVDHIRHHQPFFTTTLAISMARNFVDGVGADTVNDGLRLTDREIEVIQLLAAGRSNKEAAADLGVSPRTIESHRNRIMKRLEFKSFSELVRFAVREKLVES
ncbi:MAG TPA: response regulator transcription factor [Candidatus Dormibacteraeota bacterium]|nr:response regulator transcription factor [Candidatus Dormibacteraeota bacterium]